MTPGWRIFLLVVGLTCLTQGILLVREFLDSIPGAFEEPEEGVPLAVPSFFRLITAVVLLLVGAGCLAPALVGWIARPFTAFIDSVFHPRQRADKPPVNLELPAYYERQSRFEDALEEYRKIVRFHPEEPAGWQGVIRLLREPFHAPKEAEKIRRKAVRRFRSQPEIQRRFEEEAG